MTLEDRELLLKDLCARLLCGVRCTFLEEMPEWFVSKYGGDENFKTDFVLTYENFYLAIKEISMTRPYLRPMSSMTEEERKELFNIWKLGKDKGLDSLTKMLEDMFNEALNENCFLKLCTSFENWIDVMTWLNRHHFDYRGLIKKNLALEAPKGIYRKENKL